jgi:hypothetical protein
MRRLLYRRESKDSLHARAEGEEGGKPRVLEYRWKADAGRQGVRRGAGFAQRS